jgi:hypothetical protein
MARRARLRLLGDAHSGYGGYTLPEDGIVEVTEEEAANILRGRGRGRGSARTVEFLEWVEDRPDAEDEQPKR